MATQKTAAVVVSHYNAWPTDQLVRLLDQMQTIPSGHPFSVRVVVNQAEPKPLELPDRHRDTAIFYRQNSGYNIGAWDHGWRQEPRADYYLFLQEECVIVQPNWLKAFIKTLNRPKVGIVGESLGFYNMTWEDVREMTHTYSNTVDQELLQYQSMLTEMEIPFGDLADHLRSLILCLRREVLEAIGGFRVRTVKHDAIVAEIGISKSVQAIGLQFRQVGYRPFRYIHHPQWEEERQESHRPIWLLRRLLSMNLLGRYQRERRLQARLRKGGLPGGSINIRPEPEPAAKTDSTV